MADLIKKIKIKKQDGTFTDYIPIGADAINVETSDGESVELKLNKKPYCYDTIANMKADNKLKAGDICQTLGYNNFNDGDSGKYKIVNDSQLVNDGINIINLNNGLKAVLIKENSKYEKKGMWGISRNIIDNIHHLIYSDDGIHWNYVGNAIDVTMADPSAVCEINGVFYYIGDGYYRFSLDLKNWSDKQFFLTNPTYSRVWASSFFYDKLTDKIYAYSAFQYSNETIITPSGGTSYKFKIVVQEGVQNENGTITFGNAQDLYYDSSRSYIDPYVIYDSVWGYMIAIKDEGASTVSIYNMTNPLTVTTLKITIKGIGIEAPQLLTDGQGNIFCYVDDYNLYPNAITGVSTLPKTQGVIRLSTKEKIIESPVALQQIIYSPLTFRHMGVALCSDKAYYLLKQIGISCVPSMQQRLVNWEGKKELREITTDGTYTIVNHPHIVYQIGSNTLSQKTTVTLNLKSVFKDEPFKLLLNNCEITWSGDIPSWWTYQQHFINNDKMFDYKELPLLQGGVTRPIINI